MCRTKSVSSNALKKEESTSISKVSSSPRNEEHQMLSKKIPLGKIGRQNATEAGANPSKQQRRKSESLVDGNGLLSDSKINEKSGAVETRCLVNKSRAKAAMPKLLRQTSSLDIDDVDPYTVSRLQTESNAMPKIVDSESLCSTSDFQENIFSNNFVKNVVTDKVNNGHGVGRKISIVSANMFKSNLNYFKKLILSNNGADANDAIVNVFRNDDLDAVKDVSISNDLLASRRCSSDVIGKRNLKPVNLTLSEICSNQIAFRDFDFTNFKALRRHSLTPSCDKTLSNNNNNQILSSAHKLENKMVGKRHPFSRRKSSNNVSLDELFAQMVTVEADIHRLAEFEASDVINDYDDYDPVQILENDIAQFKDFRLPNNIVSIEDIWFLCSRYFVS